LYSLSANEPTKVECTLVYAQNALLRQSRGDRRGKDHSDGWGIACYRDGVPRVERRATAAHEDIHFSATAERVYSTKVVAHVRRATVGPPSLQNTHPFTYGPWTFAHNGTLRGVDRLEAELLQEIPDELRALRVGNTDSELIFYWLLGRMRARGQSLESPCTDLERLTDEVREGVAALVRRSVDGEEPSRLTVILTDGRVLVASRWQHSLFLVRREGVRDCDICGIPHVHHDESVDYRAVVLASEPISSEAWEEVPEGSVVAIGADLEPAIRPIA
jgi:glutamine amidotransferase